MLVFRCQELYHVLLSRDCLECSTQLMRFAPSCQAGIATACIYKAMVFCFFNHRNRGYTFGGGRSQGICEDFLVKVKCQRGPLQVQSSHGLSRLPLARTRKKILERQLIWLGLECFAQ